MPIDPIKLTQEIKESYARYLTSAFRLRDKKLRELFYQEVEKFWFTNGPILEATPPFKKGCYLKDLIDEHLLSNKLYKLTSPNYVEKNSQKGQRNPLFTLQDNPLYLHQENALRKILNGRNVVIASGTNSGKTECFLLPIYNHLLKQHEEGKLTPGVRALLLYPMNVLANDQLRRLREIARIAEKEIPDIQITFGRYVGDTPETKKQGEEKFRLRNPGVNPVKSELLSREEMRENPPHILITNYAMLEYLLLRPKDSSFFDGEYATHWKFLVLDEAHIYSGANGIEMGMLIRRLKDRVCEGKKGVLQSIATSATLVKGEKDFKRVAKFATNLFGERFEWDAENENQQDIIKGEKVKTPIFESKTFKPSVKLYSILDKAIRGSPVGPLLLEQCYEICKKHGVPQNILAEAKERSDSDAKKFLCQLLSKDEKIIKVRDLLEEGPTKLEKCVKQVFETDISLDTHRQALVSLVNIAVWARPDKESLPLLPARYHLFVRAPEGIFVSFYPKPRIFLERREKTEEGYAVFDLASCRRCGQEYLVGDIVEGELKHSFSEMDTTRKNRYFLLWKEKTELEEDEDEEVAVPEEIAKKGKIWKLCIKCGAVWEKDDVATCNCGYESGAIRTLIEIIPKNGILNKCYLCGLRSINIVREFIFQQDAPAAVLATALFQNLKKKKQKEKKILAFSDSRQDAAFFASYLDHTYRRILFRHLIIEALQQNQSVKDYRLQTLCNDVLKLAEEKHLFDPSMDEKEKKKEMWGWILQEFCALDRRICLEGVGLLFFFLIPPKEWKPIDDLSRPPWNLSENESIALYRILINTLRFNKAITFPNDGPSPRDEIFARFHRNREYKFRSQNQEKSKAIKKGIYSFIPTSGQVNTRLEFLQKLYKQITGKEANKEECRKLLGKIWDDLETNWTNKGLYQFSDSNEGVLFQLDYKYWQVVQEGQNVSRFICDKCALISPENIRGVCPTFGCNGKLESLNFSSRQEEIIRNHYRYLYTNLSPVNMTVHEHTAQLKQDYASNIQQKFIEGGINVLSCSTTFELGVDLGELETIFLRNVPPEPSNYIQRSGRAGRRLDLVGFTLTFAQLRSHDLTYFKEPEKMVGGQIKPPVVEIRNEKIIRRHLHSVVLAKFFREHPDYFGNVDSFFNLERGGVSGSRKLQEYLENKPVVILESLKRTIPDNLHDTFDLENWGWIKSLLARKKGALETADAQIRDEYASLRGFYGQKEKEWIATRDQRRRNKLNTDMRWADDRMNTIKRRQLIDFLATHTVIPKYGFPVDVVELTPLSHIKEAKNIRLERDLRIAISEFAPGSQVVANGYIWESAGLKAVKDRTWPVHWYAICANCRCFNIQEGTIEDNPPTMSCKGCQKDIVRGDVHRFITPIFGFVTSREVEPGKPGESRPKREFATRPYFFDYQEPKEEEFNVGKLKIKCQYSTHGELAVICKGRKGVGFWICFKCGAAFSKRPKGNAHKSPIGEDCSFPLRGPLHLGHTFKTDVLTVSLRNFDFDEAKMGQSFWYSLLYAILEGASQALGIRRQDLDGCLYPYEGRIALVLFDDVPGGAGHVERIMDKQNLYEVLQSALGRVKKCTCGPETSCYGCLRNYRNQFCHEQLKRGIVLDFLERNLGNVEKEQKR